MMGRARVSVGVLIVDREEVRRALAGRLHEKVALGVEVVGLIRPETQPADQSCQHHPHDQTGDQRHPVNLRRGLEGPKKYDVDWVC